ncbi:MAG: hypothetical protein LWX52_11030 [Deltaproteobacteria bacterium]|jgi:hypothetical protein|nr:hypothetical protein [Deltaproteobacteria bacterium]
MNKRIRKENDWAEYYDDRNILDEITDESVYLSLDDHLREDILSGKRKRKPKNNHQDQSIPHIPRKVIN